MLSFEEVTSRTFASLQSSRSNSCDMHRVLQQATERFRKRHLNFALMKEHQNVVLEDRHTKSLRVSPVKSQRSCANWSGKKFYCLNMILLFYQHWAVCYWMLFMWAAFQTLFIMFNISVCTKALFTTDTVTAWQFYTSSVSFQSAILFRLWIIHFTFAWFPEHSFQYLNRKHWIQVKYFIKLFDF